MPKGKILLLLLVLFAGASCKKDSRGNGSPEDYYIKAKLNGQLTSFGADAIAQLNGTNFAGFGRKELLNAHPGFSMNVEDAAPITIKSYRLNSVNIALMFRYTPDANKIYYLYNSGDSFTITIEDITNEYVKGVFNGTIRADGNASDKIEVTEGSFKLKRI
jgi:hypothetical protein